jgi:hypothetical protein
LCHLGGGAGGACWRSEAGWQFWIDRANPIAGCSDAAEHRTANKYSDGAADRFRESTDVTLQRSRIKLDKPALRGQQHPTLNRKSKHDDRARDDAKRVALRNHAGDARGAKHCARHRLVEFGFVPIDFGQQSGELCNTGYAVHGSALPARGLRQQPKVNDRANFSSHNKTRIRFPGSAFLCAACSASH